MITIDDNNDNSNSYNNNNSNNNDNDKSHRYYIFNNYSGPAPNRHSCALVSGQLFLRPSSQNPFSIPIQTVYIFTLIPVSGHSRPRFRAYELDFGFGVF